MASLFAAKSQVMAAIQAADPTVDADLISFAALSACEDFFAQDEPRLERTVEDWSDLFARLKDLAGN